MAKCTDCLCYDACKTIFELAFRQTLPEQPFDKAENCKNFKEKSKFVEVVRCKDCRYYDKDALWCDISSPIYHPEHYNWYEEDFCSYGERRGNEA